MATIGKKATAISMTANFDKEPFGDAILFRCKVHKDAPPMFRHQARAHIKRIHWAQR